MRTEKHVIGMLALITSTSLIYQNCGSGFGSSVSGNTGAASSSQSAAQLPNVPVQIVAVQGSQNAGANIDFNVTGNIPGSWW